MDEDKKTENINTQTIPTEIIEEEKECKDCKCKENGKCRKNESVDDSLDTEIENLKKSLEEERNAKLRFAADCENLKKMFQREREELVSFSQTALLMNLLEIIDDLNNVIKNVKEEDNPWFSGVKMVYEKLINILTTHGVEIIEIKKDSDFDPQISEAVGSVKVDDKLQENKIVDVVSLGYKRKGSDKIIRSAKVIVTKFENI